LFVQCNIIDDIGIYSDPLITSPSKTDILKIEEKKLFLSTQFQTKVNKQKLNNSG
jgi:hypothetical protein